MLALKEGHGTLRFQRSGARTVVARAGARSPLCLLAPRNHGTSAWVYTSTHGGGLVTGDTIRLDVGVDRGAEAVLLSQASTKVYRGAMESAFELDARVDGTLWVLPDHVVPFADATFVQRQRYELDEDASLLVLDAFTSGRVAMGERWRFRRYASRIDVRRGGRRIFLEALDLDSTDDLAARRFDAFATLLLCGPAFAEHAASMRAELDRDPARGSECLVAASALASEPTALVVRIAATDVERLTQTLRTLLAFAGERLGDDPWTRRR